MSMSVAFAPNGSRASMRPPRIVLIEVPAWVSDLFEPRLEAIPQVRGTQVLVTPGLIDGQDSVRARLPQRGHQRDDGLAIDRREIRPQQDDRLRARESKAGLERGNRSPARGILQRPLHPRRRGRAFRAHDDDPVRIACRLDGALTIKRNRRSREPAYRCPLNAGLARRRGSLRRMRRRCSSLRQDALLPRVDVEALSAEEPDQGHPEPVCEIDRQAAGGRDCAHHGNA